MRVILMTLILDAFVPVICAQQTDFDKADLRRHHVKRVTAVIRYPASSVTTTFIDDYDRRGNLTKRAGVDSDGGILIEWSYRYDDHDEMVESSSSRTRLSGATTTTASRTYGERGLMAATLYNADGSVNSRTTFKRTAAGKPSEVSSFNAAGKLTGRSRYVYDDDGNEIEFTRLDAAGAVVSRSTSTFTRLGNATRTVVYDAQGRVSSTIAYEYGDAEEHLSEKREYDGSGRLRWRTRYERNAEGFIVEAAKTDGEGRASEITRMSWELYR